MIVTIPQRRQFLPIYTKSPVNLAASFYFMERIIKPSIALHQNEELPLVGCSVEESRTAPGHTMKNGQILDKNDKKATSAAGTKSRF
jgi:hypothetical protein